MKECMEQVKRELGRDAVILHTKKYKDGGFFGYGGSEVVEVTAAIEDQPENQHDPAKPVKKAAPKPVMPANVLGQYKTAGTQVGVDIAAKETMPGAQTAYMPQQPAAPVMPARPAAPAGNHTAQASRPEDQQKIQQLENELAQMKSMLAQVMSKNETPGKVTLQEALQRQGVAENVLKDFAAQASAGDTLVDEMAPEARDILSAFLESNVLFQHGLRQDGEAPHIAALIGPTGVGKTTTLAKIAARLVLEKNVRAALITADTYRISAVEQLKTYSDIIGLPLEIVYTPDELRVAIHKHRDKDLILIDTAGRSQHNAYQMKELQDFLKVSPHIEKHLVMSATTKDLDAADILQKFSVCKPDGLIFTKTDETRSLGLIVNLLYQRKDIRLSFLTNGQSVPDDIRAADAGTLADLLLGA